MFNLTEMNCGPGLHPMNYPGKSELDAPALVLYFPACAETRKIFDG